MLFELLKCTCIPIDFSINSIENLERRISLTNRMNFKYQFLLLTLSSFTQKQGTVSVGFHGIDNSANAATTTNTMPFVHVGNKCENLNSCVATLNMPLATVAGQFIEFIYFYYINITHFSKRKVVNYICPAMYISSYCDYLSDFSHVLESAQ